MIGPIKRDIKKEIINSDDINYIKGLQYALDIIEKYSPACPRDGSIENPFYPNDPCQYKNKKNVCSNWPVGICSECRIAHTF